MAVVFKGGTSGNRDDHSAPTPLKGIAQPVLTTETHEAVPANIHLKAANPSVHQDHYQHRTPDFMPTCGEHSDPLASSDPSTDVMDPGATTGGDESVFKGAPSTGTKGGPA